MSDSTRIVIVQLDIVDPKRELDVYAAIAAAVDHAADHGWVRNQQLQGAFAEVDTTRIHR